MYIVERAYSDNTADILDIFTLDRMYLTEKELISFGSRHDVMGLISNGHRVVSLSRYSCITFPTELDAYEYKAEIEGETGVKVNILEHNGYYYALYNTHIVHKVAYYVLHWTEYEQVYVSKIKGSLYTPYENCAKAFSKEDARKKAYMMNKRKGFEYWTTKRVVLS